jgi:alkanesulfonate monooxygenase SsuD/methylene tetrahydromethanopterin reductase-like flavin-dependent oxidoreductase (luciferase family)
MHLGTLVSCVAYSNPCVLARTVADLDRMSGARAILGLGSGDMPREFRQLGIPWRPAAERLPIIGTPDQASARVRTLIDAGFQYVIFITLDAESLELAGQEVIPAVLRN